MPYTVASDTFRLSPSDILTIAPRQMLSITPSDSADLSTYVRALTCTGGGTVSIVPMQQNSETAISLTLTPGQWTVGFVRKVNSTGTTATGIVGALL